MNDGVELRGPEDVERLIERGREAGALAALRLARESASAAELHLVADGFRQLNQWLEAAETLRRAAELRPDEWQTWAEFGEALVLADRLTEATVAYQQAVDLSPDAVKDVLQTLLDLKHLDEAIELFTAARERHPDSALICQTLATTYGLSGDNRTAAELFRSALDLDPEDPRIRYKPDARTGGDGTPARGVADVLATASGTCDGPHPRHPLRVRRSVARGSP